MGRRAVPWRKHGGPSKAVPLEKRSLEALEAIIELGAEPMARLQLAKKVRRNKHAGKRSGQARAEVSASRAETIRAAAALHRAAGVRRFVPQLMEQFGVSRSTVMRAVRSKVCHEPNSEIRQLDGQAASGIPKA